MLEKIYNIFHREAEHFKYNHPANKQKAGNFSVEKQALDIGTSLALRIIWLRNYQEQFQIKYIKRQSKMMLLMEKKSDKRLPKS